MNPRRRTAMRSSAGRSTDNLDEYKDQTLRDLLEDDNFKTSVHQQAVTAVLNRLEAHSKDFDSSQLQGFIKELFNFTADKQKASFDEVSVSHLAQECRVKVTVLKAENLAAKDSDGTSDPYCILSVVEGDNFDQQLFEGKGKYPTKKSSPKNSDLNPEWNETFEFKITRENVANCSLQVQIWDLDDATTKKKIKGLKGMGR